MKKNDDIRNTEKYSIVWLTGNCNSMLISSSNLTERDGY